MFAKRSGKRLANFGPFVDISEANTLANNRLDMDFFHHSRPYAAIDVDARRPSGRF